MPRRCRDRRRVLLEISPGPGQPDLRVGDKLRLVKQTDPTGTTLYSFNDYARGQSLLVIGLIFLAVIVIVALGAAACCMAVTLFSLCRRYSV